MEQFRLSRKRLRIPYTIFNLKKYITCAMSAANSKASSLFTGNLPWTT